jgi:hypothetical protein
VQTPLSNLMTTLQPWVDAVTRHSLFPSITTVARLQSFAEIHVYAVWDFACLLRALQHSLIEVNLLWTPPANPLGCHLINTLLAEEESDALPDGRYLSHFQLYLEAMQQCGADTGPMVQFIQAIKQGMPLHRLLELPTLPKPAKNFIADTFKIIAQGSHVMAASLTFARENITSGMFTALLERIPVQQNSKVLQGFVQYFQRHIDLDSSKHNQQSQQLLVELCGTNAAKWHQAQEAAQFSLDSRLRLLDGIYAAVKGIAS